MSLANRNDEAIIILCSHLCIGEGVKPYEPTEWSNLAQRLVAQNVQPYDLLSFSARDFQEILSFIPNEVTRIERLISRSASIAFEVANYENIGIKIVTRADANYPQSLKKKLGQNCPPLFYYSGNLDLAKQRMIGFTGSRTIGQEDLNFTIKMVQKAVAKGYGIVSGGAKGIDSAAATESLQQGAYAVEYISDSMQKKLKNADVIKSIREDRLLILSVSTPNAGFNIGLAMMRNRYIYASSIGTIVVKSDLEKGGTWAGATENLRNRWCPEFCWNNSDYPGNVTLIQQGAIPITSEWNFEMRSELVLEETDEKSGKQISLFD